MHEAYMQIVNCRVGSLEILNPRQSRQCCVNCRVGSLEIEADEKSTEEFVNCRVGSLEKAPCTRL